MAVSSALAKLETFILSKATASASPSPSSHFKIGVSCKPRRTLIQRGNIRSEVAASDVVVDTSSPNASTLSALEQLKFSAADRYTKERSSIVVIGLSIHTAPVEMREKLAIPEAEWPRAIGELCALNHIEEAAVLSTCNRMEIYLVALSQHRGVKEVTEWMSKTSGIPVSELCEHRFLLYNKDATRHIFEVSAGLDSLVLGEGQILAQVKQVVRVGQGVVGFGRNISGLFKHAITVGKRVRTETNIAAGAVSVSSAAVELALMKLPYSSHSSARMLIIGAGKMGKLVIKHLASKGCTKMVIVNRTEEKVNAIREEFKDIEIVYKPLTEMMTCAAEADVIFTSTSSETPLFFKENVVDLPRASSDVGGMRLFIDISVPRNVGSCVKDLENTKAYNVDDLKEVVAANKEDRLRKAMEAQVIIDEESKQFEAWRDSLETVPTIKKLRAYAERIRGAELEKCLSKMGDDISKKTRRAVDDLSRGIVNKLLHGPMQHLRCDGSDDRTLSETLENMHALNRMFSLETEISVLEQKIRAKVEQQKRRCEIAETLVEKNFDLAFQVIYEFNLSAVDIYAGVASSLADRKKGGQLTEFFRNIKGTIDDEDWDQVLGAAINVYANKHKERPDRLIDMLTSSHRKVLACVVCGRLKSAFQIASRSGRVADVQYVAHQALHANALPVLDMCKQWLAQCM